MSPCGLASPSPMATAPGNCFTSASTTLVANCSPSLNDSNFLMMKCVVSGLNSETVLCRVGQEVLDITRFNHECTAEVLVVIAGRAVGAHPLVGEVCQWVEQGDASLK